MTIINDCSDPNALEQAHEVAIAEATREMLDLLDSIDSEAAAIQSAVDDMNDVLDTLLAPMGSDPHGRHTRVSPVRHRSHAGARPDGSARLNPLATNDFAICAIFPCPRGLFHGSIGGR